MNMSRIDLREIGTEGSSGADIGRVGAAASGSSSRCGPTRSSRAKVSETPHPCVKLRFASLNVGTMRGRASEVVETLTRRRIDICCVQESRWKGGSARFISGKDSRFKFFWSGEENGLGGVGILIAEKWVDSVLSVARLDSRIINMRFMIGKQLVNVFSIYAPQSGLSQEAKDVFYDSLQGHLTRVPENEFLTIGGDFNGHVGRFSQGFDGVHGNHGYGARNDEGTRILDLCVSLDLAVVNTFFTKSDSRLVTFKSGGNVSQVDYIMVRRSSMKMMRDAKVIGGEECVTQHKLLVADLALKTSLMKPRVFPPKRRLWKLTRPDVLAEYTGLVNTAIDSAQVLPGVENSWSVIKTSLTEACEKTCGWTRGGSPRHQETWWWNENVDVAVKAKRKAWKEWQNGGCKEAYLTAKRTAKSEVYRAKKSAAEEKFSDLRSNDKKNDIFKLARRMKDENCDVVGEKCIKDENGVIAFDDPSKLRVWKEHYEKLLNVEFPWDSDSLPDVPPIAGPPPRISADMVASTLKKMKSGKAPGPSGLVAEMLRCGSVALNELIAKLATEILTEGKIPSDWNLSYIINCFKGKGDALKCGNYRGLKLLDQVLKVIERIVESVLRSHVDIDDMQFGFMPGRGTTDAIFILRQLHEKFIGKRKNLYFIFIDLEKAFDRVPRRVLWWALRKFAVPEWLVRSVQAMYADAKSSVRVNGSYSPEFNVQVGVHQGSVLSPLLFIIVMDALSQELRTGCPWELLYADDLVIVAKSLDELTLKFSTWKQGIEAKGLRVNMAKTKVLCSTYQSARRNRSSGKHPCGVCHAGVGNNSIFCRKCGHWIHKACSGVKGRLLDDPDFVCRRCTNELPPSPGPEFTEVLHNGESLEVVQEFCYLGDVIGSSGGCYDAITARMKSAWKSFRELLPILSNRAISFRNRGHIFNSCVRSVLLYACETWPVTVADLNRLLRNDNLMVRWICGQKLSDRVPTAQLQAKLGISSIDAAIRKARLRWFGHTVRMEMDAWPKSIQALNIPGSAPRGRPQKRWIDCVNSDLQSLNLRKEDALDRLSWRSTIKSGHARVVQPSQMRKTRRKTEE